MAWLRSYTPLSLFALYRTHTRPHSLTLHRNKCVKPLIILIEKHIFNVFFYLFILFYLTLLYFTIIYYVFTILYYVLSGHWQWSSLLILPLLHKHLYATFVIQSITVITHSRRNITTVIQKCTAVRMYERCDPDKIFKRHYSQGPPRLVSASFQSSGFPRPTMLSCSTLQNKGLSHPVLGWAAWSIRYSCRPLRISKPSFFWFSSIHSDVLMDALHY